MMSAAMRSDLTKLQLLELANSLAWNDGFGCYTRPGFEKLVWPAIAERVKWLIYFDVDGMHDINESHGGYDAADAMIKEVLSIVRMTDYVAGQWKSGDEFLVCITEEGTREASDPRDALSDPLGMVERLMDGLAKQGLSATFAVVEVTSKELAVNVKPAVDKVYGAKKTGRRGSVQA
jgi:GGDEF domain-containing protein